MSREVRAARQQQVTIDGRICSVYTVKTGPSTWLAYGNFGDLNISQTGRTESNAMVAWHRAAEYKAKE